MLRVLMILVPPALSIYAFIVGRDPAAHSGPPPNT
jgi:hypothetical protein